MNNSKIVRNMEGRNVDTIREKSPKQSLTINLLEEREYYLYIYQIYQKTRIVSFN